MWRLESRADTLGSASVIRTSSRLELAVSFSSFSFGALLPPKLSGTGVVAGVACLSMLLLVNRLSTTQPME